MSKITNMRKVKQDDKFSLAIREIQSQNPENKKCFDCDQRGPTYVNMTIGSFVCTKCSGMLRGINPPHRIKSISMSSFTSDEVEMVRSRGNAWCAAVWLGNYNKNSNPVDFKDDEKVKEFIVAKYEKKRYYVDPSQANLSSIKQQLTGGSTGSADSHGSHKLHSSSLIGSTIRSRMDPGSVSSQNSGINSFVVSRPDHVSHASSGHVSQLPVRPADPPVNVNGHTAVTAPVASTVAAVAAPAPAASSSNFANFADFDTAAFDSLPPDPLTTMATPAATSTLPPMNRKSSTGAPAPAAAKPAAPSAAGQPAQAASDKYSALAELDDLFRSTTIDAPVVAPASAGFQQDVGGLFSMSGSKPPAPTAMTAVPQHVPTMIMSDSPSTHNGSPGWAAAAPPAGWSGRSASPAAPGWGGRAASPATAGWGTGTTPAGKTSPMWTPQWGATGSPAANGGTMGLAGDTNITAGWMSDTSKPNLGQASNTLGFPQNTNPFGSSPSNPPVGHGQFPDNNNVFAAAPFNTEKPGLTNAGNPWSVGSAGFGGITSFTSAMTPAQNPNNPFL